MHQHHTTLRLLISMVSLLLLGAAIYFILVFGITPSGEQTIATSTPVTPPAAQTSPATSSPVSAPTTPIVPVTPVPTVTITNSDNGKTILLTKGQHFIVQLGDGLHWTVSFDPSSSVTTVSGPLSDGAQGTYEANQSGTVTLKAQGAAICNPEQPCPQFLVAFTVTLEVK